MKWDMEQHVDIMPSCLMTGTWLVRTCKWNSWLK